jgi:hypothetical protein
LARPEIPVKELFFQKWFDMVFRLWNKWGMNTEHPMTYRLTWSAGQRDFTDFSEAHAAFIALIDGAHPEAELVLVDG